MPIYHTRKAGKSYGHELGVLQIDCDQPLIPGDVGNAGTWPFTVLFQPMHGCTIDRLIHENDTTLIDEVRQAVQKLEAHGVRAITSNCGFMIQFQDQIASEASVPVFLSPLLQLPYLLRTLGGKRPVGVMTASTSGLSREILALAHVKPDDPTPVYGVDQYPEFNDTFMHDSGVVDSDAVEDACVDLARKMVADHPDMGAILLECAVLPPYANAMQKATGLPVFDFVTMAEQFIAGYHRPRYEGHY